MPDISLANFTRIPAEELTKENHIGSGGYAEVYSARWQGKLVAVKEFIIPKGLSRHHLFPGKKNKTASS